MHILSFFAGVNLQILEITELQVREGYLYIYSNVFRSHALLFRKTTKVPKKSNNVGAPSVVV